MCRLRIWPDWQPVHFTHARQIQGVFQGSRGVEVFQETDEDPKMIIGDELQQKDMGQGSHETMMWPS